MKVAATVLNISKSLTVASRARFRLAELHLLYTCAKTELYSTSLYTDQGSLDTIFYKIPQAAQHGPKPKWKKSLDNVSFLRF